MLRPVIAAPTHPYLVRLIAFGFGCAVVGAAVLLARHAAPERPVGMPTIAIGYTTPVTASEPVVAPEDPPPPALSTQVGLVFTAKGATYMKLASLADGAMPKHGKPVHSTDEYVETAVARVEPEDVAAAHRAWLGKRITVDGTCTATVVGFAVVSRLVGDPGYAGLEEETWSARSVMEQGAKSLAARLDNCAGGTLARDAALSPIAVLEEITNPALAVAAKAQLVRSRDARAAQDEWTRAEQPGTWFENEGTETTAHVLRHPRTGVTWVSVHLYYGGGCGLPNLSVWGLYRVDADGTLTRAATKLGELTKIEQLVDIDGDGELEVLGRPWLGVERTVQAADGKTLQDLTLPFFSCPC